MIGDGFGGRLWYKPTNFSVGSYSGYTICEDSIDSQQNQLFGWGSNNFNQLGVGLDVSESINPIEIPNIDSVKYFSTGYVMGAIKFNNTGWAWGIEYYQEPVQVILDVKFCDAGSSTVSFVKNNGTVWSVGYNTGNFGNGTENALFSFQPIQMNGIQTAVRVAVNSSSTCVLLQDSTLMVTGKTIIGLGDSILETLIPLPIQNLPKIIDVKSNQIGTIALAANGDVYYWGIDDFNDIVYHTPVRLDSLNNIVAISACDDGYHYMALDVNKNCYAFGRNMNQFGDTIGGNNVPFTSPTLIGTDVIDIMAGESFSYIVKSDGSLWATGGGSIWLDLQYVMGGFSNKFHKLNPEIVQGWCGDFDAGSVKIPNVFTPNDDGINDEFEFVNFNLESLDAVIVNRWGNVVKTFKSPSDTWDGTDSNGILCSEGVYFYVAHIKLFGNEWITKKGNITLIR